MRIYIGSDHAGFKLKEKVKWFLLKEGHVVEDVGPFSYKKDDDYPDYSFHLAEKVSKDKRSFGVIIAGSGIGECVCANKVKGIRAVLYHGKNRKLLKIGREHDNANVLCFGSWFVGEKEAKDIVNLFMKTKFSGESRHKRRLGKIEKYESEHIK